jgi:hypothetical protein
VFAKGSEIIIGDGMRVCLKVLFIYFNSKLFHLWHSSICFVVFENFYVFAETFFILMNSFVSPQLQKKWRPATIIKRG